jgi:hypothetical protein
MTQAIVVSALLALTALLLQQLAGRSLPARLIWSGALLSSLALVLVAPFRMAPPSRDAVPQRVIVGTPIAAVPAWSPALWRHTWSSNVDRVLTAPVQWSTLTIGGALNRAPKAVRAAVTLAWPLETNAPNPAADYVAARIMNVNSTGSSRKVFLPEANQASVGECFLFNNVGSTTFTVVNSVGTKGTGTPG